MEPPTAGAAASTQPPVTSPSAAATAAAASAAATAAPSAFICPGHTKAIVEVCFSAPTTDGVFFISGCLDKAPMLRDGATGDWIGTFKGHKGAVWAAKLNAAGTIAVTGSADFSARLWDSVTGAELALVEHPHVVKTVDLSRDDSRLVTGCQDRRLRLFSLAPAGGGEGGSEAGGSRSLAVALLAAVEHPKPVRKVAIACDSSAVYSGGEDGVVRVWPVRALTLDATLASCPPTHEFAFPDGAPIMDMELSADGATLTVASGRTVTLLDAATLAQHSRHDVDFDVFSASLHPVNKRQLLAAGSDIAVHIIDVSTGSEVTKHKGHHGIIHCVRWAPDGATFISGADDALIRLWKADSPPSAAASGAAQSAGGTVAG